MIRKKTRFWYQTVDCEVSEFFKNQTPLIYFFYYEIVFPLIFKRIKTVQNNNNHIHNKIFRMPFGLSLS